MACTISIHHLTYLVCLSLRKQLTSLLISPAAGIFESAASAAHIAPTPWTRTEPHIGNRWRTLANGARVKAAPIWLYCDDTSGNQSKKWNKHNSLLFTLASLPPNLSQLLYNIHFLATSNLAPPLEMIEYLVKTLRYVICTMVNNRVC